MSERIRVVDLVQRAPLPFLLPGEQGIAVAGIAQDARWKAWGSQSIDVWLRILSGPAVGKAGRDLLELFEGMTGGGGADTSYHNGQVRLSLHARAELKLAERVAMNGGDVVQCECGNRPDLTGFEYADAAGVVDGPYVGKCDYLACMDCGRHFDVVSGAVLRVLDVAYVHAQHNKIHGY